MAPYPAATPAPIPAATNAYSLYVTTTAPLTTTFTPPAACATNLPTVIAGSCSDMRSCYSYGSADFSYSAFAWENMVWWTSDWKQNGALSCYPSGFSNFNGFTYSPAVACPAGYATLSWSSLYYGSDYAVVCCPAGYSRVYYDSSYSNYLCTRYMTPWDTGVMVAIGGTTLYDDSSLLEYYETVSVIKTSTFSSFPGGISSLLVYAKGLELRVAKSLVSDTPRVSALTSYSYSTRTSTAMSYSTNNATGPSGLWSTYDGKPHLFRLSFPVTIVVMFCFALAGFCILACCWGCLSACCGSDGSSNSHNRPRSVQPSRPATSLHWIDTPAGPTRYPASEPSVFTPLCSHKMETSCMTGGGKKCCGCEDTRTLLRMKRNTRVAGYCLRCKPYWNNKPPSDVPTSWDQLACQHKRDSGCIRNPSASCCGCEDTRLHSIARRTRVASYCWPCRSHWLTQPKSAVPSHWDPLPCLHKLSSACMRDTSVPCCGCKDTRRSRMTRTDRIQSYCLGCWSFWKAKGVNEVPSWWDRKPDLCKHKAETSCTLPDSKACCTCEDEKMRPKPLPKDKRVKTYCGECLLYWSLKSANELPFWWRCSDADKSTYSYFLHAKFKASVSMDEKAIWMFQWFTKKVFRSAKYLPSPENAFKGILDWGPTYALPRFYVDIGGRLKREPWAPDPRAIEGEVQNEETDVLEKGKHEVLDTTKQWYSERRRTIQDETRDALPLDDAAGNLMDIGPTFAAPKFEVPADAITPSPSNASSKNKQTGKASRKSFTPETRERKPWDRGLQRNQPKFLVSEDGTVNN